MTDYIIEGNTIREIERDYRMPYRKPVSDNVARNRAKASSMNAGYVAFLFLMAGIFFIGCVRYINLRNTITEKQKIVGALESEVASAKLENDEKYDRIMGSVDMEEIKRIAMDELDMRYPDSGQVALTESSDSDYVRQYKEIPKK